MRALRHGFKIWSAVIGDAMLPIARAKEEQNLSPKMGGFIGHAFLLQWMLEYIEAEATGC
jgi:hypothetical protein